MKARTNWKVLRYAIAGSLAVHTIFAAVVHSLPVTAAPEQPPTRGIIIIKLPAPSPSPTPPPRKPQHEHPHRNAVQQRRPHVDVVRTHSNTHTSPNIVVASFPPGTPIPEPSAGATPGGVGVTPAPVMATSTPKPACSAPDVAAKAVDVVTPEAPPDAAAVPAQGKVRVDLDASGNVTGTSMYLPTGYPQLDRAAIDAARETRYEPEKKNCKDVAGSYLFTVDFQQ
jgi:protein TonB